MILRVVFNQRLLAYRYYYVYSGLFTNLLHLMLYNIIGGVTMLRILIVEDEKPIANLITMNLRMEGYNCTTVYDGEESYI